MSISSRLRASTQHPSTASLSREQVTSGQYLSDQIQVHHDTEALTQSMFQRYTHYFSIIPKKLRVRSFSAASKICFGGPCSTITPLSIKITWSATSRAKPISWVTTT